LSPPLLFAKLHPGFAMFLNEFGLDGLVSPHHFFIHTIPEEIKGKHKLYYDIPLDTWGFVNSFQPILLSSNPYYSVFSGYRNFLSVLYAYRIIGLVLTYKLRDVKILSLFPNLFIAAYFAISLCHLINYKDVNRMIAISFVIFYIRELYIITLNKTL